VVGLVDIKRKEAGRQRYAVDGGYGIAQIAVAGRLEQRLVVRLQREAHLRIGERVVRDGGPDLLAGLTELAGERGDLPPIAADLLRVRRHLAHAALEQLVDRPPTAAAVRALMAAIDVMAETVAVAGADTVAIARATSVQLPEFAFGLPPVLQLARVPPLRVIRRDVGGLKPASITVLAIGVAGFAALLVAASSDLKLGLIAVGGFAVAVAVFALLSWLVKPTVRRYSMNHGDRTPQHAWTPQLAGPGSFEQTMARGNTFNTDAI